MSLDTNIFLPPNVRVGDVASVLGRIYGKPAFMDPLGASGGRFVRVKDVDVREAPLPQCCKICILHLRPPAVFDVRIPMNQTIDRHILYHFEGGAGGRRMIGIHSRPPHHAVGMRLVDFFGGEVDFNDCDLTPIDYAVPWKSDEENMPDDGEPWDDLQCRIFSAAPLSEADLKRAEAITLRGLGRHHEAAVLEVEILASEEKGGCP